MANSELRTFQLCRRKWYLAHVLEFAPNPETEPATGVIHLGSSIHLALEAYYGYGIDPASSLRWMYAEDARLRPSEEEALDKEHDLAKVMTLGFLEWAAAEGIDAAVEILSTEIVVSHDVRILDEVVTICGKLDQLARRRADGALVARDFKTVGTLSKAQQLRISSQLKFYALIQALEAKASRGETVAGGEYLLILRSKRTSRATPPFYERVEVPLNHHDLNSQWLMTMALVREILTARRELEAGADHRKVAYPHFGDWCSWGCPFSQVCPLMDDGSRWHDALEAHFIKTASLSYYSQDKINSLRAALSGT